MEDDGNIRKVKKRIILTGGGTLGSVTPLIAIMQAFKNSSDEYEFLFIGTHKGIEKDFIQNFYKLPYKSISSGKLRRYFSFKNFIDPFKVLKGFFDSLIIIKRFKPDLVISAGGFVSVPLVFASWLKGISVIIHQLDIKVGLANRIMSRFASYITCSFDIHKKEFQKGKVSVIGTPIRQEVFLGKKERAKDFLQIDNDLPTILVLGGSTGARNINLLIKKCYRDLLDFCNIVLITGKGKDFDLYNFYSDRGVLLIYETLKENFADVVVFADIVISRAGLATISELLALAKPMIIIPISNNQQEQNALFLKEKNVAMVLSEKSLYPESFIQIVKNFLNNKKEQKILSNNAYQLCNPNAAQDFIEIAKNFL